MPELPEVETTRRGIEPHVTGQRIARVIIRDKRLRYPVPAGVTRDLPGQVVHAVDRRGKYLLLECASGTAIIHLGMSGSLLVVRADTPAKRHDHVDIVLENELCLRLRDPRRFGALLWTAHDPLRHRLLKHLGPEPLSAALSGAYLFERSRKRRIAVKPFIMDSRIVVGVGNIYASEALFLAGIHPLRAAGRISAVRYQRLVVAIRQVLNDAIAAGGTTLRNFYTGEGRPGYFRQQLRTYEQAGAGCTRCGAVIRQIRQGQRSTYYCGGCQS